MTDRYYTTSITENGKETITSRVAVDFAKNPQNIRELVQGIRKLVPEVHDKFEEIYALIKTYVHSEKHFYWNDLKHWIDAGPDFLHKIADGKKETHSTSAWQNFDKNLEWVNEYQKKDTRINLNGETTYLRGNHRKSTYQEVVEKVLKREATKDDILSVTYRNKKSGKEGILSFGETIEVEEDTIFSAFVTGDA